MGRHFEEADLASESSERLSDLTADRSASDDSQAGRDLGQRKDRFIGEYELVVATRNRWNKGPGPCGDDGLAEPKSTSFDFNGVAGDEVTFAEKYVDAQVAKSAGAVVVTDAGP